VPARQVKLGLGAVLGIRKAICLGIATRLTRDRVPVWGHARAVG